MHFQELVGAPVVGRGNLRHARVEVLDGDMGLRYRDAARIQYGSQDGSGFELAPAHRRAEQRQQQACAKRGAGTTVSLSEHGQLKHATVNGS
jgi:hypothetical protein